MEILFWIIVIIWVVGWIRELAKTNKDMHLARMDYPSSGVKYAMPVILFIAWPYFYFYGKS